jgi:1-acyl-sn-glycerol-3-phosphate acyltransferase
MKGYRLIRFLDHLLVRIVARVEATGLEKLPARGAYIATANHLGVLDPLLVYDQIDRRDIIMLVAEKYRRFALARWLVKSVDAIYVERFSADFAVMRQVLERLSEGWAMIIAPEGTRSKSGQLLPGRSGAAYLAAKSGVPVVPVAVTGTEDRKMLAHLKRLRRSPIKVVVGDAYTLPPLPREGRDQALKQYTDEIMCRIAVLLPEEYRGVYKEHPMLKDMLITMKSG